jgi:hypothetical protein
MFCGARAKLMHDLHQVAFGNAMAGSDLGNRHQSVRLCAKVHQDTQTVVGKGTQAHISS